MQKKRRKREQIDKLWKSFISLAGPKQTKPNVAAYKWLFVAWDKIPSVFTIHGFKESVISGVLRKLLEKSKSGLGDDKDNDTEEKNSKIF